MFGGSQALMLMILVLLTGTRQMPQNYQYNCGVLSQMAQMEEP